MIRFVLTALLLVTLGMFLTLWAVKPDVARDIGIVYAVVVATASAAIHLGERRG